MFIAKYTFILNLIIKFLNDLIFKIFFNSLFYLLYYYIAIFYSYNINFIFATL